MIRVVWPSALEVVLFQAIVAFLPEPTPLILVTLLEPPNALIRPVLMSDCFQPLSFCTMETTFVLLELLGSSIAITTTSA